MNEFRDYNLFLKKNGKKNILSLFKTTYGLGFKSVKKINLLNGGSTWQFKRVTETSVDLFNKIKTQINFFYSLEKNKIFTFCKRKLPNDETKILVADTLSRRSLFEITLQKFWIFILPNKNWLFD